MAEPTHDALESQIAKLQKQLEAKRAESGSDVGAPLERAEVHAVIGEQIQQVMPSFQAPATAPVAGSSLPSWQDPALADAVQGLVNVAFTQNLQDAINQAVATGNAALIDAFHDVLADKLHMELIKRNKVEPAL